ncbi:hypothetical protein RJ641_011604 [Dillenia turbinata]|uniref:Uncharacterized protein n=1 Tax=Dillenia turbinata TaxID=194707 RepID=A0AAN8UWQ5_9MAGN
MQSRRAVEDNSIPRRRKFNDYDDDEDHHLLSLLHVSPFLLLQKIPNPSPDPKFLVYLGQELVTRVAETMHRKNMDNGYGNLAEKFSGLAVNEVSNNSSNGNTINNDNLFQIMKAVEAAEATIKQQVEENNRLRSELQKKAEELEKYKADEPTGQGAHIDDPWSVRIQGPYRAHQAVSTVAAQEDRVSTMDNASLHGLPGMLVLHPELVLKGEDPAHADGHPESIKINGTLKIAPGGQPPGENAGLFQFSSTTMTSPGRYQSEGDYDPQLHLSPQGLMPMAEVNNPSSNWKQEAQIRNDKFVLEKRIAYMRMAFDQQQQDLVDAASKALSYRQDIIEENICLAYALQDAQQERSTFVSSLLPLLAEYSLQPPVADAQSIVSNLKIPPFLTSEAQNPDFVRFLITTKESKQSPNQISSSNTASSLMKQGSLLPRSRLSPAVVVITAEGLLRLNNRGSACMKVLKLIQLHVISILIALLSLLQVLFKHLQEKLILTETKLKESQYQLAPWQSDIYHSNLAPSSFVGAGPTTVVCSFICTISPFMRASLLILKLVCQNNNGLELVAQPTYSPGNMPDSVDTGDLDILGQRALQGAAPKILEHDDAGRYSPLVSRKSAGLDAAAHAVASRGNNHPVWNGEEFSNKQVKFSDPVSNSEMEDPVPEGYHNELSSGWTAGNSQYKTTLDDPNSYSYLPPVLEEPSSSFSEAADDDPLPAIDDLQISGEAFPGRGLQAGGYSINGTTSCNFEWVRHLEDGSVNYIEGAKHPNYLVTADDVETYLAIEVQPLDNRKRKGELVKVFANENKKITCGIVVVALRVYDSYSFVDPEMHEHIEKNLYNGQASYKVSLLAGHLDIWEPAILTIKKDGYRIKCSGSNGGTITEKFSQTTSVRVLIQ